MEYTDLIGKGIYTVRTASRLVGINYASLSRWVRSFDCESPNCASIKSMWCPEIINLNDKRYITFRDLVELRMIQIFRKHRIKYKIIAALSQLIARIYNTDFPMSSIKLSTDMKNIYIQDNFLFSNMTNVHTKQITLPGIGKFLEKEIYKIKNNDWFEIVAEHTKIIDDEIIKEGSKQPTGWKVSPAAYPKIVIRPTHYAGYPTAEDFPTSAIYKAYLEGNSYECVANMYDISYEAVLQAVNFETKYMQ